MDHQRMMETCLSLLQTRRLRIKCLQLFIGQNRLYGLHCPKLWVSNWQGHPISVPAVGPRNKVKTTSFHCLVVQGYMHCHMKHGCGPSPIGVVLMPCNDPSMMWRLGKQLVVPQANSLRHFGWINQLGCRDCNSWEETEIMKSRAHSPLPEGMEEDIVRRPTLVPVEFIK